MSTTRIARAAVAAGCLTLLAGCGSSAAKAAKPRSFEQALGIDEASLQARMAKVQEAVRACMKTEGFDYVPVDSSQSRRKVGIAGPGATTDTKTLRTKGYGITAGFDKAPRPAGSSDDDPNEKIRSGLSDADKEAYDRALYGSAAAQGGDTQGGRGFHIQVRSSGGKDGGPSSATADDGCFGKAERQVPGGPATLGASLKDLQQRIQSDPRLVAVDRQWAACMNTSGYSKWEHPDEIPKYLIDKLAQQQGSSDGSITIRPDENNAQFAALHDEELTIAKADADCRDKTHRDAVATKVRDEAQQRFLDEHPDLTAK